MAIGPERSVPGERFSTKDRKKLRWAHVSSVEVNSALNGLLVNTVVALPESCVQASGIQPNISDKNKPKKLWLGRLRYLRYLLTASLLEHVDSPEEVRKTMLQSAVSTVELCRGTETNEMEDRVAVAVKFANMSDVELTDIARAAVTIQSAWRGVSARKSQRVLDVLDDYFSDCPIKGCVLLLCGSSGIAADSLRYMRMLAGQGYLVVAPDHLASNSDFFSRQDASVVLRYEDSTDYWQRNLLYDDQGQKGELTYSSTTASLLDDPEHFDHVYNNIITIRQAGMSLILRRLPEFMKRRGIFCYGMSEGAVVLSSFNDEMYTDMIRGRILCSYSCEQNYWNYNRPEDAGIAGSPLIPTLNIMGYVDEYFGYQDSVAATVARSGEYPPITGNAFDAMVAAGIEWGLVAHLEGGRHALTFTHDDVIRELLSDFLDRPQYATRQIPHLWSHVHGLQDEITRVRRSADNKVTYIRIRRPDPGTVVSQSSDEGGRLLLDKLNRKLYQLQTDQPLSPMNEDGACGRTFDDLIEVPPKKRSGSIDMPSKDAPPSTAGGLALRRSVSAKHNSDTKKYKPIAATTSPMMIPQPEHSLRHDESNVRELQYDEAAAEEADREGQMPTDSLPGAIGSRREAEGNGTKALESQQQQHQDEDEEEGHARNPQGAPPGDPAQSTLLASLAPSSAAVAVNSPPPELPRLIINNSLVDAASQRDGFFSGPPSRPPRPLSSTRNGGLIASRASSAPSPPRHSAARLGHTFPDAWTSNWVEELPVPPGSLHHAGLDQHQNDSTPPANAAALRRSNEPSTPACSHHHHQHNDPQEAPLQEMMELMSSQAKASASAHESLRDIAKASTAIAVAGAVSSVVTAVALTALLGISLMRKDR